MHSLFYHRTKSETGQGSGNSTILLHSREKFYSVISPSKKCIVKDQKAYGFDIQILSSQHIWCIAKSSTNDGALKDNLEFACTNIDCSPIKEGSPCFYPDTLISQASVAMNLYYQDSGKDDWDCNFNDSGLLTVTDPSKYEILIPIVEVEV